MRAIFVGTLLSLAVFSSTPAQAQRRWPAAGSRANRVGAGAINPYSGGPHGPVHAVGVGTNLTAPNNPNLTPRTVASTPTNAAPARLYPGVNIVEK